MSKLMRNHRTLGIVSDRFAASDGKERVLLQTAPHREEVALAHLLQPVSDADLRFEVLTLLCGTIEQARFLGLDNEQLTKLFTQALAAE